MSNRPLRALFMVMTPLLLVAAWWGYVRLFKVPRFVLPPPAEVGSAFVALFRDGTIWPHLAHTLGIIVAGFAIGSALGFALGFMLGKSPRIERTIGPYLFFFQTAPKIALAPLFILWFGIGIKSKIVLATSLGFFIVLVAMMGGLRNVDRDMLLMSRLYGASERHLFWYVRLPWSLPGLFAGLRLTLVYCTGGAVIGEMIAAQSGLGLLLQTYSSQFNIAQVLAILLVLVVMVSVLTGLLEVVENRLLRWSAGSTDVPS